VACLSLLQYLFDTWVLGLVSISTIIDGLPQLAMASHVARGRLPFSSSRRVALAVMHSELALHLFLTQYPGSFHTTCIFPLLCTNTTCKASLMSLSSLNKCKLAQNIICIKDMSVGIIMTLLVRKL